jgi:hypothetical protein
VYFPSLLGVKVPETVRLAPTASAPVGPATSWSNGPAACVAPGWRTATAHASMLIAAGVLFVNSPTTGSLSPTLATFETDNETLTVPVGVTVPVSVVALASVLARLSIAAARAVAAVRSGLNAAVRAAFSLGVMPAV